MLSIPRPDIVIATAPLVARRNAPRMRPVRSAAPVTPSGVGASSTSVPSKSTKKAVVASGKLSGRFCISICLSAGEGPEKCAHVTALCNPVSESGAGRFVARTCCALVRKHPTPDTTYHAAFEPAFQHLFSPVWPRLRHNASATCRRGCTPGVSFYSEIESAPGWLHGQFPMIIHPAVAALMHPPSSELQNVFLVQFSTQGLVRRTAHHPDSERRLSCRVLPPPIQQRPGS